MAPDDEIRSLRRYALGTSLDRIRNCLEGLTAEQLAWTPPAPGANSLQSLALHALGNAEENILGTLLGEAIDRDRDAEFESTALTPRALLERVDAAHRRIQLALERLTPADLGRACAHPRRGMLTGREVLLIAGRHAAEHAGQAELTRDLVLASSR